MTHSYALMVNNLSVYKLPFFFLPLPSYYSLFSSFLGYVDKIGSAYESDTVANGFGAYIALVSTVREYRQKVKGMFAVVMVCLNVCVCVHVFPWLVTLHQGG